MRSGTDKSLHAPAQTYLLCKYLLRIHLFTVLIDGDVEVGTRGHTRAANVSDGCSLAHPVAHGIEGTGFEMAVKRNDAVAVVNSDAVPEDIVLFALNNTAACNGNYLCAVGCADIDTGMVVPKAGNRMVAAAEFRSDPIVTRSGPDIFAA